MDRHDWELLDRQMSHLQPTPPAPRRLNTLVLVGSFLTGMTTGAFLFASAGQPVQKMGRRLWLSSTVLKTHGDEAAQAG